MKVLNIRTQQPLIGMQTQNGQLDMRTPPITLDIDHGAAKVDIHTVPSKLEIDQYPVRASYGVLSVADRILQESRNGMQKSMEGIARRAREDNQFLAGGNVSHVIANREKAKLFELPEMKVELCQVASPKIKYTPSKVNFEPKIRPVSLKVDAKPVDIKYTRPEVNIYLEQKSDVKMWVTEDKYDIYA